MLKKKGAGRRQKRKRRGNREMKGWGEGMTETNASPLTAVLYFHRDRHKIEDQKSNKSVKD